ncbi:MAG TPA: DUF4040 domain-containing protein [Candidatus Aenigmarchaeota archaeon]|nr:DUF4040 domain-containing protein [Candidatus Aenigmarchaeota archaeon]
MILEIIHTVVLVGMVSTAVLSLRSRDLLVSTVLLAAMSLLLSLEFYLLQAPDVAIAEAGIGAGIYTAVYIIAITKTNRWEDERQGS